MQQPNKVVRTLQSRKFWATVLASLLVAVLYWLEAITGTVLAACVTILVGLFVGSTGLEDGLSMLGTTLKGNIDYGKLDQENVKEKLTLR